MTIEEMKTSGADSLKTVDNLLSMPYLRDIPKEEVLEFEAAADDLGVEFLFHSQNETMDGPFSLHVLGIINGLLAKHNKTLVMEYNSDGDFTGLHIADEAFAACVVEIDSHCPEES